MFVCSQRISAHTHAGFPLSEFQILRSVFLKRMDAFPTWMISSPYPGLEAFGKHIVSQKSFLWLSMACPSHVNYRKPFLKKDAEELRAEMGYLEPVNGHISEGHSQYLGTLQESLFLSQVGYLRAASIGQSPLSCRFAWEIFSLIM